MDRNPQDPTPPAGDDHDQIVAKLRGLERMALAGLIDEEGYRAKFEELQGRLDTVEAPAPRGYSSGLAPPPVPPRPDAPVPPPLVVSTAAPAPAPSPPQETISEGASPEGASSPGESASLAADAPSRTGLPGSRGALIAAGITAGIVLAGAVALVLATRGHNSGTASGTHQSQSSAASTTDAGDVLASLRTASPSLPGVVMDASDADKLVRAFWLARERAISGHDTLAVRELETGSAAEWDAVGCTVGCAAPSPRDIGALRVFVPRQAAYPASFLAEALTTEYHSSKVPMVELMVFTRSSAQAPWSLALDTGFPGISQIDEYPVPVEGGAFDAPPPTIAGIDHAALPSRLAAYWQHWADSGAAPPASAFVAGPFTDKQGQAIHESLLEDRANGIADSVRFSASGSDGVWTYAVREALPDGSIRDGWAISCGTVRIRTVSTSVRSGGTLVQDTGFSPFGVLLTPGAYTSVTEQGQHQTCFLTAIGTTQIAVVGINGQNVRLTGVIAHAGT